MTRTCIYIELWIMVIIL
ncbi:hypothetical protein M6B38_354565 [Iris pallida]|uniref:Uncharacterized protein n=1 Tax=Iris pallida TaxID=29817 RepID=A0AAX6GQA4_IRIPA|nr:hypothetical protein M6B38_354565 [Iris pallida]